MIKKILFVKFFILLLISLSLVAGVVATEWGSCDSSHETYYRTGSSGNCHDEHTENNLFTKAIDWNDDGPYTLKEIYDPRESNILQCFNTDNFNVNKLSYQDNFPNAGHDKDCTWAHGFIYFNTSLNFTVDLHEDDCGAIAFFWYDPQDNKFYLEDYYETMSNGCTNNNVHYGVNYELSKSGWYLIYLFAANNNDGDGGSFVRFDSKLTNTDTGNLIEDISDAGIHINNTFDLSIFEPDESSNYCKYLYGDSAWNESISPSNPCCGDDSSDFGIYQIDDTVYLCSPDSGWGLNDDATPGEYCGALSGVTSDSSWEETAVWPDATIDNTYNGSDGCCGDDGPGILDDFYIDYYFNFDNYSLDPNLIYASLNNYADALSFQSNLENPFISGKQDSAIFLNGQTDYVDGIDLYPTASYSFWIKTNEIANNSEVKNNPVLLGNKGPDGMHNKMSIAIYSESGNVGLWWEPDTSADFANNLSTINISDNKWHNIILLLNRSNNVWDASLFVDGIKASSLTYEGDALIANNYGALSLGALRLPEDTNENNFHNGTYDELIIIKSHILSLDEIQKISDDSSDLYYLSSDANYFCFDDASDNISIDFSDLDSWRWLDANQELYTIHHVDLPEYDVEVMSNGQEFYQCNASGFSSLNFDSDHSVGHLGVISDSGNDTSCPGSYYYCGCMETSYDDDLGWEINSSGTPNSCIYNLVNSNPEEYAYLDDGKKCVVHPSLCNSDLDDVDDSICSDQEEMEKGFDPFDSDSTPDSCSGFDPNNLFWPPEIGSLSDMGEYALKNNVSNDNLFSFFDDGVGGNREVDCADQEDNDGDGVFDCDDPDCASDSVCADHDYVVNCSEVNDDGDLVNCDVPYCYEYYFNCSYTYNSLGDFVTARNNSVLCYDRSNQSLFVECCDNYGVDCGNAIYQKELVSESQPNYLVDFVTQFVGRGVGLYSLRNFDWFNETSDVSGLYLDYVRYFKIPTNNNNRKVDFTTEYRQNSNKPYPEIDHINFDYYDALEFDIAFTKPFNVTVITKNLSGDSTHTNFTFPEDLFNYSNNGLESYLWHHMSIPLSDLPDDADVFYSLRISSNHDGFQGLIDNIYLGVNGTVSGRNYSNYRCAGAFGFWLNEFDPDEASGMSCQNINSVDDLTACNFSGVFNESTNAALTDDGEEISEIEFDPFRYVCDSTLSYGWTGHYCCGDDTNTSQKEFHWDTESGCWNGFNIKKNKVVGEVLNPSLTEDGNTPELSNILFYDDFYNCSANVPSDNFSINSSEIDNLPEKIVDNNSVNNIVGNLEVKAFNNACGILGNHYCDINDNVWSAGVVGVDDFDFSEGVLFVKSLPDEIKNNYDSESGCCPLNYCWNGSSCVSAESFETNSTMPALNTSVDPVDPDGSHILFSNHNNTEGFRCVMNTSGNASWEKTKVKYDWRSEHAGYCRNNYCFVDSEFEIAFNSKPVVHNDGCCDLNISGEPVEDEFDNDTNSDVSPGDCLFIDGEYYNVSDYACKAYYDCVPSNVSVFSDGDNYKNKIGVGGDYYCNAGNWTTKTAIVADNLINLTDNDDYSLVCDDDLVLNLNVSTENDLFNDSNGDLHSVCVLNAGDDTTLGFVLNNDNVSDILNVLVHKTYNASFNAPNCENLIDFGECNGGDIRESVYYDPEFNVLYITNKEDLSFNEDEGLLDQISGFFYNLFHPSFKPDFNNFNGNENYKYLYRARNGDNQYQAHKLRIYNELYSAINETVVVNATEDVNLYNTLNFTLFEHDVLVDNGLVGNIRYGCVDNSLKIFEPSSLLSYDDFEKEDMLWTYITKSLRLQDVDAVLPAAFDNASLCMPCTSNENCSDNLVCNTTINKCQGNESFDACLVNADCNGSLVCNMTTHKCE
jgi:hypothetical protein